MTASEAPAAAPQTEPRHGRRIFLMLSLIHISGWGMIFAGRSVCIGGIGQIGAVRLRALPAGAHRVVCGRFNAFRHSGSTLRRVGKPLHCFCPEEGVLRTTRK